MIGILFILATVPILFGAVQPWVRAVFECLIFATFVIAYWKSALENYRPGKVFYLTAGLFFIWTLFQFLPLPHGILKAVNAFHYGLLEQAAVLTGSEGDCHAISVLPLQSLDWWIFLLSLAGFFIVLRNRLVNRRDLNRVIFLMIVVALVESFYGILQVLVPSMGVLWVDDVGCLGNARGTFINRNHFAGFINMIWPLGLAWIMVGKLNSNRKESRKIRFFLEASNDIHKQIVVIILVVLMILSLVFSASRAGITSAVLAFIVFSLLIYFRNRKKNRRFLIVASGILGLFFLYGLRIGFERIIERFLQLGEHISRIDYWKDSLVLLGKKPLGIGLGNFEDVFRPFFSLPKSAFSIVDHLHNDYLQLLIEAGWPGFVLLAGGFFYFLCRSFFLAIKNGKELSDYRFFMGIGALSGLVSMGFHSLFDFNLRIPANCVYFLTLMAVVQLCLGKREILCNDGSLKSMDYTRG